MEGQGGVVSGVRVRVSLTELTEWRSEAAMRASRACGAAFECGEIRDFVVYKSSTETRTPQHTSPHITSTTVRSLLRPTTRSTTNHPPQTLKSKRTYALPTLLSSLTPPSFRSFLSLSRVSYP